MIAPADMRRAMKLASDAAFFDRPLVILSAPRSGSTLLFELLARSKSLWSIGRESHAIIEDLAGLAPGEGRVFTNRLVAADADEETAAVIRAGFIAGAVDSAGVPLLARPASALPSRIRFLEKTPKNTLRVPFLRTVWPDARFVLLVREPHSAVGSMIEAWESQKFVTYPSLPGISGAWSMLLPDGYADAGRSSAERAAFQWRAANEIALADVGALPSSDWCVVDYATLVDEPALVVDWIARFADLDLSDVPTKSLPLSTHTLSAPAKDKWRRNVAVVEPVVAPLISLFEELLRLRNDF